MISNYDGTINEVEGSMSIVAEKSYVISEDKSCKSVGMLLDEVLGSCVNICFFMYNILKKIIYKKYYKDYTAKSYKSHKIIYH